MSIPYQTDIGEKAKKVAALIVQGHGRDVSEHTITRLVGQSIQEERDRCALFASNWIVRDDSKPNEFKVYYQFDVHEAINSGKPFPKKSVRLRYDLLSANRAGNFAPATSTMAAYSIAWESTEEFPAVNCVVFEGCTNIPDNLPSYITALK